MSDQSFNTFTISNTVVASVANPNRDGSGTLAPVLEIDSQLTGIILRSVTVTAQGTTTQGMVRLFLTDNLMVGASYYLIKEIPIPGITPTAVQPSFSTVVDFPLPGFRMNPGWALYASTEKGEAFNVTADCTYWNNFDPTTGVNIIQNETFNTTVTISTGNSNRDGSGAGELLLVDISADGVMVNSVTISAVGQTTQGMIRFFGVVGGVGKLLLQEIPIPSVTPSATVPAFTTTVGLPLAGFLLGYVSDFFVTTQNSEAFIIATEVITTNNYFISA